MREKGFTLFTALISFILIVLSLLLVQSMISTEASVSEIVNDISEQQEMQAIADLTRADALQGFNFGIRYTIEQFSTERSYILFEDSATSWNAIKEDFVKDRFGVYDCDPVDPTDTCGNKFASRAAQHLIFIIETTTDARGFNIGLENADKGTMEEILDKTMDAQAGKGEFFEVVNCENGEFHGCLGTFYVTLDLSPESMSVEDYEKFPLVTVVNAATQRALKEPILPRGTFRIYVPIRLFKALAAARQIAKDSGGNSLFDLPRANFNGESTSQAETRIRRHLNTITGFPGANNFETEDGTFQLDTSDIRIVVQGSGDEDDRQINRFDVTLKFEETNTKYMVSEIGKKIYTITLTKFYD